MLQAKHGAPSEGARSYSVSTGIGVFSGEHLFGKSSTLPLSNDQTIVTTTTADTGVAVSCDPPSDLLTYLLWKDIISSAGLRLPMLVESIKEWPLLPVVVGPNRSRRLFASPALLPLLLMAPHTDEEDAKRAGLVLEEMKLSGEVMKGAEFELNSVNMDSMTKHAAVATAAHSQPQSGEWNWCTVDYSYLQSVERLEGMTIDNSVDGERKDDNVRDEPVSGGIREEGAARVISPAEDRNNPVSDFSVLPTGHELISVLGKMNVPFLDGSIFEEPPVRVPAGTGPATPSLGRSILNLLHVLQTQGSFIHECKLLMTTGGGVEGRICEAVLGEEPTRLLQFELLTVEDRRVVLLEIFRAHNSHPLTVLEIDMLKDLPLFTSRDGVVLSLAQCSAVYWCLSEAVLQGLSIPVDITPSNSGSSSASNTGNAVILYVDEALQPLYQLLGAEQLTPAVAVRRFTLPALNQLVGSKRVEIMRGVANHWANYRDDVELVQLLKTVAFVPSWHVEKTDVASAVSTASADPISSVASSAWQGVEGSSRSSGSRTEVEVEDFELPLRCPNQLFSWTNGALLEALRGEHLPDYFPPSAFRQSDWHVLMLDLGMASELDKESMLRLACDIQDAMAHDESEHIKVSVVLTVCLMLLAI